MTNMSAMHIIVVLCVIHPFIRLSSSLHIPKISGSNIYFQINQIKKYISNKSSSTLTTTTSSSSCSWTSLSSSPQSSIRSKDPNILHENPAHIPTNINNKDSPTSAFDFGYRYHIFQYLWPHEKPWLKLSLILALFFMVLGKWLNLQVPFLMQETINILSHSPAATVVGASAGKQSFITKLLLRLFPKMFINPTSTSSITIAAASLTIVSYGLSRALSTIFAEIKTCLFARVSFSGLRKFANQIFEHLHELDADFHLKTPSGVISVAYVRAIRGFQGLLFQIVFSVIPTLLELVLVARVLNKKYGSIFSLITLSTFTLYGLFTIWITQWRIKIRNELVTVDNSRNGYFIDSILNHEVVKYFTNEDRELKKFDSYLKRIQELNIENTIVVALLNFGQVSLFSSGLSLTLLMAMHRVQAGVITVGDLITINGLLLQLSIPFNFMGYTCK